LSKSAETTAGIDKRRLIMTAATETDDQLLVTRNKARHLLGDIGETKLWQLEKEGEIEVVRIGRRSLVVAESCRAYTERLRGVAAERRPANTDDPYRLSDLLAHEVGQIAAKHGKRLDITDSAAGLVYRLTDIPVFPSPSNLALGCQRKTP
jgi:hypothetical protein